MTRAHADSDSIEVQLAHGTRLVIQDDLPVEAHDRRGNCVFAMEWDERSLRIARFTTPDGHQIELRPGAEAHTLFGTVYGIGLAGGPVLAHVQAIDWAQPEYIPPMDRPAALPAGVGSAVLNFLALQAARAERAALRYRGPYPTGALFDALTECFTVSGGLAAAFTRFTEGVENTAATARAVEPSVDFAPAPFERVWWPDGVCVQLRDGVEKVYLNGRAYARDAAGARRVRRTNDGWAAVVEIAGDVWAERLQLDVNGGVLGAPLPLPAVESRYAGQPVPETVRALLATFLPARAPDLLRSALEEILASRPMLWGDAGDELAVDRDGAFVLHTALPERLSREKTETAVNVIVEAVEPVVHRAAQQHLAALVDAAVERLDG